MYTSWNKINSLKTHFQAGLQHNFACFHLKFSQQPNFKYIFIYTTTINIQIVFNEKRQNKNVSGALEPKTFQVKFQKKGTFWLKLEFNQLSWKIIILNCSFFYFHVLPHIRGFQNYVLWTLKMYTFRIIFNSLKTQFQAGLVLFHQLYIIFNCKYLYENRFWCFLSQ